ncbi:unnamed protein product [Laminaria digitata]
MVNVLRTPCLHDSCQTQSCFNVEGSKTAAYCKAHAEDGMVNVRSRRCSHVSCQKQPNFNVEGSKTAAYCKTHAMDGMVNIHSRRCSHGSCHKVPTFNVEGSKTAAYCKQHAKDGMVDVCNRLCSHASCTSVASWGLLIDGVATVCAKHKSDCSGDRAICFKARCGRENCGSLVRWGLPGKQPTRCPHHGPLQKGFFCTVGTGRSKSDFGSPSHLAVRGPSFRVKTECMF